MKKILLSVTIITLLTVCKNKTESNKQTVINVINISDTLPDAPRFVYMLDAKSYAVDQADIAVHYSSSDSSLTIDAGKNDGDRLHITISDIKNTPGFRGNAWRSDNTKLAGSDSLIYQPTLIFYKNDGGLASWNNFSDGYHESQFKRDNSLYIYGLRQTGERNFIIKGRVNTRLLKNVYESASEEFNKDHDVSAEFVIQFEDYWLKL